MTDSGEVGCSTDLEIVTLGKSKLGQAKLRIPNILHGTMNIPILAPKDSNTVWTDATVQGFS